MKKLFFLLPLLLYQPANANEMMININVNRLCATIIQIPYASDNFSDEEWGQFQQCLKFVRQFDGVE
jgi:hypothetical protein